MIGASLEALGRRLRGKPRHAQQIALPKLRLGRGEYYGRYAVAPDLLHRGSVVYSCGVGDHLEFELELIARFGCTVHTFDPGPSAQAWVKTQALPAKFVFHPLGLLDRDGVASLAPGAPHVRRGRRRAALEALPRLLLPRSSSAKHTTNGFAHGQAELPVRRLSTLMDDLGHGHIDLLKLNIEGSEYAVIDALQASGVRPTQLLVEFHHHLRHVPLARTERALTQLNRLGYRIFDCQQTGYDFSLALV